MPSTAEVTKLSSTVEVEFSSAYLTAFTVPDPRRPGNRIVKVGGDRAILGLALRSLLDQLDDEQRQDRKARAQTSLIEKVHRAHD